MVLILTDNSEPYIRLPAPHSHIILTPPRLVEAREEKDNVEKSPPESDINTAVSALNDKRVYLKLESTPYPYMREHAIAFARQGHADTQRILQQQQQQGEWFDGCPFRDIRDTSSPSSSFLDAGDADIEHQEIAQATKIGDLLLHHYPFYELPVDSPERKTAQEKNAALPAGHEDLIWGIGFWLLPTYHGKGIMSAVLKAVIEDWAIPKMNMRVLKSSAYVGNEASVGVFRKCGFMHEATIEKGSAVLSESRGGGKRDIHVLRWERKADGHQDNTILMCRRRHTKIIQNKHSTRK
ncbi:hypothetical protein UA08_08409 [Talaromyces atroroseus]|uniref:N-acetyltransferase domain-containing protein n=1 Tax=Talaromyces atroroseus TaxID=1441469 RepID=A0A1Q5Q7X6_TALAT|nr:hypothetical protein UA08_08409 [Talaromyces atroroseus]OKL56330.1 hypothetical protein UA08_08409 [Talaromyces atroroseus]